MAVRVFLDANILFSAAKSDGAVRALVALLGTRGHERVVDAYVVAEARRNLEAKGAGAVAMLDRILRGIRIEPAPTLAGDPALLAWLPEKDRPILAAAIRLRCDVLLTGDRAHFGKSYGRSFGGVTLHSPRSLFDSL